MKKKSLFETCYNERAISLEHVQIGWFKKNALDLIAKYYIFLLNSIGNRNSNTVDYLFVDEIKNNSMSRNLLATKKVFDEKGEKTALLSFYKLNKGESQKFGYLRPISEIFCIVFLSIPIVVLAALGKRQDNNVIRMLSLSFERMINTLDDIKEIYLMSDHHFFSSIIALEKPEKCSVLQHGLIMDKRFYYPIRASRFLAWGSRSWELENGDPKVFVAGTYKFSGIKNNNKKTDQKTILFCIGSLNVENVKRKIDILLELTSRSNICLAVKCHPGSLFNLEQWKELYKDKKIVFYKEELIQTIAFDIAVSENSTVVMDLIAMRKPFIIFDDIDGYYSKYADIVPHGDDIASIGEIVGKIDSIDFSKIVNVLSQQELNSGICSIYENRRT